MAKELPYFRFTPQEWQNGDISLERYELRGLFIDICSYYWVKNCSITKAMLHKRYSNDSNLIKELIDLEIINFQKNNEYVQIIFLDEQFDVLSEQRKRRQLAGSKGGKQNRSNAKAKLKQNSSYKDKDKDKDKDNKRYSDEIKYFTNSILKYFPYKPKNIKDWYKITEQLIRIDNYTFDDILLIVENFTKDEFWAQNFQSYNKLRKKNKDGIKYIDYFKNNLIAKKNGKNIKYNKKQQGATTDEIQQIFNKHFNTKR